MEFLRDLHIINSSIGLVHTIAAILAMIFGTMVFFNKKGTNFHKKLGYAYIGSMLVLNITAFAIYNFGSVNLFHAFAIISLLTIVAGMIPVLRKTKDNWLENHFAYMSWSVVGLYCAFWAEVGVRLFDMRYFWWVVMLAGIITSGIGGYLIYKQGEKLKITQKEAS